MASQSYLIFSSSGLQLALEAAVVREIIRLPEITPLAETPPYLTGVINLRGHIIPVMDLNRRFGRPPPRYRLTDSIIVLALEDLRLGLIVNAVHEVICIAPEDIDASPSSRFPGARPPQFATRVAKVGGNILMVLNHLNLLPDNALAQELEEGEAPEPMASSSYFCPDASPEERAVFHQRAVSLRPALVEEDFTGLSPTAVVGLNGEYFGVDLELVREFAAIRHLILIPCCPDHIVGNMNLRGNILTLVDIRNWLDLPGAGLREAGQVMVAALGELSVGIVVDQVFDIIYLNPADLDPLPTAIRKANEPYLQGTALYGGKVMTVLNLANLLSSEGLVVAEEP